MTDPFPPLARRDQAGSRGASLDPRTVPPTLPRFPVKRTALIAHLMEARHRSCVVLQGPAGSGKSTVVAVWAQALRPVGFESAWLTLSRRDNDVSHLFDGLLATLAQLNPAMGAEENLLAGQESVSDELDFLAVLLVRAVTEFRREVLLVLDDFHLISDARAIELLQWLLDYAPANLHLVLCSRNANPLSLARLRAQAMVMELDQRELRFSADESQELLQGLIPGITIRESRALHELADGWVLGLHLLAAEWQARGSQQGGRPAVEGFKHVYVQDADAFSNFFEREVLSRLTGAELEFLVSASICERFTASLSASLAGRPEAVGEAMALLRSLQRASLFVSSQEQPGEETLYILHPLLRQALQLRLRRGGEAERRRVHALAWPWFRDHGQFEEAVRHAVMAGNAAAAADLIERVADRLRAQGAIRSLARMLRQLPDEVIKARVGLRLWRIRIQIFARDLDGAAVGLEDLDRAYPDKRNPEPFPTMLVKASLAVQRDRLAEFIPMLPQMLKGPSKSEPILVGECNNLLSWFYLQQGDYERARQFQQDNGTRVVEGRLLLDSGGGSLQGRCFVGLSYALEGRMTQAERIYRDVLYESERAGGPAFAPFFLASALLGEVLYEIDDRRGALELLAGRVDSLEQVSIPDSVLRVMTVLSRTHWLAGRRLEAFAYIERLEEYALRLRLNRLLGHGVSERFRRYLQLGEFDRANGCLTRLEELRATETDSPAPQIGSFAMLEGFTRLEWMMANGDLHRASIQIETLSELCESRNEQRTKVLLWMRKAVLQWQLDNIPAAEASLLSALRIGRQFGLMRRLLDADPAVPRMLRELMPLDPADPVLALYLRRLRDASQASDQATGSSTPLASTQSERSPVSVSDLLSEREIDVVRCLTQALSNKKIARSLGVTPETVKWHFKNIFSKLNVSSRDEALARVRDLGWGAADDVARGGPH